MLQMSGGREAEPVRCRTIARTGLTLAAILLGGALLGGCENDSFFDPSVNGRWETTPTTIPILEKLSGIEDDTGDLVEYSEATSEDLVPAPQEYRLGPGDVAQVSIRDFVQPGMTEEYDRPIDILGMIDLPQIGQIYLSGKTIDQARAAIEAAVSRFVQEPLVAVVPVSRRTQTFNIIGAIESPSPYIIPSPDYRLLEALTAGGRFSESVEDVFVIRQVYLAESGAAAAGSEPAPPPAQAQPAPPPENLIDVIEELAAPKTEKPNPAPGLLGGGWAAQPVDAPAPAIELEEAAPPSKPEAARAQPDAAAGETSWVFLDGKWVRVRSGSARAAVPGVPEASDQLVTQRVIRIPLEPLLAGDARYNIIIRPGDIVRVPAAPEGLVYMAGQVNRQGPIQLPPMGRLTLMRAVDSAGGLGQMAIPERVDITRILGPGRQAIVRVNLRAIAEGTQPDVYLKADDRVNVGSNFWAIPLAVLRNGFRASYGFGMVIDRNFGNDIFGAPPFDRGF